MCGIRLLKPLYLACVPSGSRSVVLEDLTGPSFEPLESASGRMMTLKRVLLLALTSLKRNALQGLLVSPFVMDFAHSQVFCD